MPESSRRCSCAHLRHSDHRVRSCAGKRRKAVGEQAETQSQCLPLLSLASHLSADCPNDYRQRAGKWQGRRRQWPALTGAGDRRPAASPAQPSLVTVRSASGAAARLRIFASAVLVFAEDLHARMANFRHRSSAGNPSPRRRCIFREPLPFRLHRLRALASDRGPAPALERRVGV